jgi:hypothetical protein
MKLPIPAKCELAAIATCLILTTAFGAQARDLGQWDNVAPSVREWFSRLTQPGFPDNSCCGDADVYYADEYSVNRETGEILATITDNRGHSIAIGTRILVPKHVVNSDPNMTNHTLIFLGGTTANPVVFCFLPAEGV